MRRVKLKITNARIDKILLDLEATFERVGDFIRSKDPLTFKCLRCNRTWDTLWSAAKKAKYGCESCSKKLASSPLSTVEINNRLELYNLKLVGHYENNTTRTNFKCLKCNHIFDDMFRNLQASPFCPRCESSRSKNLRTNEQVDRILDGYSVKRIGNYIGNNIPILFKCLNINCGHEYPTQPSSVFKGSGCPKCYGNVLLTNDEIDRRLINRSIRRVSNYINQRSELEFQCLNDDCLHKWTVRPAQVLHQHTGCPLCNVPGHNEKLILKIFIEKQIIFKYNYFLSKINNLTSTKYRVDFYLPNQNLIIEYNGAQHYKPTGCFGNCSKEEALTKFIKQQQRDLYVDTFCKENDIDIIWIDGRSYYDYILTTYIDSLIQERKIH